MTEHTANPTTLAGVAESRGFKRATFGRCDNHPRPVYYAWQSSAKRPLAAAFCRRGACSASLNLTQKRTSVVGRTVADGDPRFDLVGLRQTELSQQTERLVNRVHYVAGGVYRSGAPGCLSWGWTDVDGVPFEEMDPMRRFDYDDDGKGIEVEPRRASSTKMS